MSARAGLGITVHCLEQVLDGDLDEFIDALVTHDQAEQLKESPSPRPVVDQWSKEETVVVHVGHWKPC